MTQQEFLRRLVRSLEAQVIPYMISGSLGSSFHGEPRATHDVDVIIAPTLRQLLAFIQSLGSGYYVSPEAAEEALRLRTSFNIIDLATGSKADVLIRKDRPFSLCEFERRQMVDLMGLQVAVLSPEDSILSKLEWAETSGSERQERDAVGVAAVQWNRLDCDYLRRWAKELGLEGKMEEFLGRVQALVQKEKG